MKRVISVFLLGLLWLGFSQPGLAARFDVLRGSSTNFSTRDVSCRMEMMGEQFTQPAGRE